MLAFLRPDAHKDFAREAGRLLGEVREEVEKCQGKPSSEHFKGRDLWSGSWRGDGRHKKALAGPGVVLAKCVWCERLRDLGRELDVEHYRPKAAVTRWDGDPPLVSDVPPGEIAVGPGYWWLAFSWDNYSLSCKTCNQGWKRNLFPMREPRPPCQQGLEDHEKPLLLDPASSFRTGDHFAWTVDAIMESRSPEGAATIVTCGLNRSPLVALRLKILSDVRAVLADLVCALERNFALGREGDTVSHRCFGQLALLGSRTAELTGMVRWWTEHALGCEWGEIEGLPA